MKPARILQTLVLVASVPLVWGNVVTWPAKGETRATNRAGAYFADPKSSERSELVEPINDIKDDAWLNLEFEPRHVLRHRLAILPVENRTAEAEQSVKAPEVKVRHPRGHSAKQDEKSSLVAEIPVAGIEELLTSAVLGTDRFYVVDRRVVEQVVGEQAPARG